MAFDYKKEYKVFYMPKAKPGIVTIPQMNYLAVRGSGDPNAEGGEYKESISLLYGIAFTIKMSKMGDHHIEGYFDYVVPPLEGFWWQDRENVDDTLQTDFAANGKDMLRTDLAANGKDMLAADGNGDGIHAGIAGIDYTRKEDFKWISVIRLPDFVTRNDFLWAIAEATAKKKQDFSKVEYMTYDEGLCVQCMHIGAYDDEPATVELMHRYIEEQGYVPDITKQRRHHEIYLSDARRVAPERLKTVIRHPIRRV